MIGICLALALALPSEPEPAPPLTDLARFPSLEDCQTYQQFAGRYMDHLRAVMKLYAAPDAGTPPPQWQEAEEALRATQRLQAVWELLAEAYLDSWCVEVRRDWLRQLRDRLGQDAYDLGAMPPPVPIWLFRPIDG